MTEQKIDSRIPGVRLASVPAGIRYSERDDLVLMELVESSSCAAVFTRNAFCAAPVIMAREHLNATTPRYLLINSGNANAGTGEPGMRACRETCRFVAAAAGCAMSEVLPFSTGVIGEDLPVEPFAKAMPELLTSLSENGWQQAARAIMTTDTIPKLISKEVHWDDGSFRVTGMAKGSGMIRPDMATMLAYVATDAEVPAQLLQQCLVKAVEPSFNAITVDGDTSTNDACVLAATGKSGVAINDLQSDVGQKFVAAVEGVCFDLAKAIVLDGEGATKLVEIRVSEAGSVEEAREVAFTVAHSPLVKTALFASDPNWGRILAAVGRANINNLDVDRVRIRLDDITIVRNGGRDPGYAEEAGQKVMDQPEFCISIALGRGDSQALVLTCDFSYDYVKINAGYRS